MSFSDGFAENAVCHATCMTNYLLKRIKDDSEDYLTFEHDFYFNVAAPRASGVEIALL
jgi:hypothetical protein